MQVICIHKDCTHYEVKSTPILIVPRLHHFTEYIVRDFSGERRYPDEIRNFPYITGEGDNFWWDIDYIQLDFGGYKYGSAFSPLAHLVLKRK